MPFNNLESKRVFEIFEQIASIPHGSGNMDAIAAFCENFAKRLGLSCIRDNANNVIIFKDGTLGYENLEPIILQGHLDMVCQKESGCNIDFEKDGLELYVDGDFLKARGTTLGADNGIAVAMTLAILERNDLSHPPIEAVFTVDEETGMGGAISIDTSVLKGTRMINLDSETEGLVTVSCAGGSNFQVLLPLKTKKVSGTPITIDINGLLGGHSGDKINKCRINANLLAGRILNEIKAFPFDIISINGGDKSNAIPNHCVVELCTKHHEDISLALSRLYQALKIEFSDNEKDFAMTISVGQSGEFLCFEDDLKSKLIYTLVCVPNGVTEMSAKINGLVQTSLNLGILLTSNNTLELQFALRSSKMAALEFLEKRLCVFFDMLQLPYKTFGHYPAWEYQENSTLRDTYCETYKAITKTDAKVIAIHAGLECGVFASKIKDFDCISIGPQMYEIHTTRERLSISSTEALYKILLSFLEKLK